MATPARLRLVYETLRYSMAARGLAFSVVELEGAPARHVAYLDGRPLFEKRKKRRAERDGARHAAKAEAPLTILLHGLGSSVATWSSVMPRIARHVPVIAVDLPGFGRTPIPDGIPFATPEVHLETALAFIDAVSPDRPVQLVGQSLGGSLAAHIALRAPDRVTRLTLANATGLRHPQVHEQMRLFRPMDAAELTDLWRRMWRRLPLGFTLFRRDYLELTRLPTVRGFLGSVEEHNYLGPEHLAKIPQPTLLVWGLDDRLIDYDFARAWRAGLPDVRFRPIPECGHVPQREKAREFLRYVLPWLQGEEPPEPRRHAYPRAREEASGEDRDKAGRVPPRRRGASRSH